jgi:hypothetical protein
VKVSRGIRSLAPALAACAVAGFAGTASASAAGSSFSTPPHNIDHIGAGQTLSPGSLVSVGFHVSVHGGKNPATTLYLVNAVASIKVSCAQNGPVAGTWNVQLPAGPYNFPANYHANGGWWKTNSQRDPAGYQAVRSFPSTWCGGKPVHVVNNGETYSGTLESSNNTSSDFHIQLHTAVPASNKSGNVDCTSTAQNPSPGTKACDFAWNGDADHLVPAAFRAAGSGSGGNPSAGSGASGGSSSGSGGSGSSGGPAANGGIPVPATGGVNGVAIGFGGALLLSGSVLISWAGRRRRAGISI